MIKQEEINSNTWIGFEHLRDFGISSEQIDAYDVLCLPENIEFESDVSKLREAGETVHFYKILRSQGINVGSMHDFGIDVPIYERRGEEIYFGVIVVRDFVLSIISGIIASWIFERIYISRMKITLRITKKGNDKQIEYDGDGETLLKILECLKEK